MYYVMVEDDNENIFNEYTPNRFNIKTIINDEDYKKLIDKIINTLEDINNTIHYNDNYYYTKNNEEIIYCIFINLINNKTILYFKDINNILYYIEVILSNIYKILDKLNNDKMFVSYDNNIKHLIILLDVSFGFILYVTRLFDNDYIEKYCDSDKNKNEFLFRLYKSIHELCVCYKNCIIVYYNYNIVSKENALDNIINKVHQTLEQITWLINPNNYYVDYNIDIIIEYCLATRMLKKFDKYKYFLNFFKDYHTDNYFEIIDNVFKYLSKLMKKIYNKKCSIILLQKIVYCINIMKSYKKHYHTLYEIDCYSSIIYKIRDLIIYNRDCYYLNNEKIISLDNEYNNLIIALNNDINYENKNYDNLIYFDLHNRKNNSNENNNKTIFLKDNEYNIMKLLNTHIVKNPTN